jgi:hypothetical protein
MRSGQVLEQPRLDVIGTDPARRCDQRADLAAPDVPATAELDACQAPASGPRPDGSGPEVDVGGGQRLGRLCQRDPVGGGRHLGQPSRPDDVELPDEPELDEPELDEPEELEPEPEEPDEPEPDEPEPDEPEPDDPEPEEPEPEPDDPEPDQPDEPDSDVPEPPDDPASVPPLVPAPSPSLTPFVSPAAAAAAARVAVELPRSFFAQPEPLKWIAGVVNCLRNVPPAPQDGQNCGAGSLIP